MANNSIWSKTGQLQICPSFLSWEVFSLNCGCGSRPWTTQIVLLGKKLENFGPPTLQAHPSGPRPSVTPLLLGFAPSLSSSPLQFLDECLRTCHWIKLNLDESVCHQMKLFLDESVVAKIFG